MNESRTITRIKAKANELIISAPTKEAREALRLFTIDLLMAANAYSGYNYIHWMDRGHKDWLDAGQPLDKQPFLGDETMIKFL